MKFIINLFGESCAGKTTTLCNLLQMLRPRVKYSLSTSEGFRSRDRREMTWYRVGNKNMGAVCVCTCGDTKEIVKKNIEFFERHFYAQNMPWDKWCEACDAKLSDVEKEKLSEDPIGILVTASRKPLAEYDFDLHEFSLLDIPIRADYWHDEVATKNPCKWTLPIAVLPESILFHIHYTLRFKAFKGFVKKRKYRCSLRDSRASISRD